MIRRLVEKSVNSSAWKVAALLAPMIIPLFAVLAQPQQQKLEQKQKLSDRSAPNAAQLFEEAKEALGNNRYKYSINLFHQAASMGQQSIELYYWLGVAYWSREQGEKAISAYRRAIELDPHEQSDWSLYALENMAEVQARTDRAEESREAYYRALERDVRPEWITKIRNQLAELELTLGTFVPNEHTVFNEQGEVIGGIGPDRMRTNRPFEIARHTNDPKKEAEQYRRAIRTDPRMYQSYFNLGLALVHQQKYQQAVSWLMMSDSVWKKDTDANSQSVDKADAHAFLSLCYLELNDLDQAKKHAGIATISSGANFWATLYSQRVRISNGNAKETLPILDNLYQENPEHAELLYALSQAYDALNQTEKAQTYLKEAIDVIPDDHPWMLSLKVKWQDHLRRLYSQPSQN